MQIKISPLFIFQSSQIIERLNRLGSEETFVFLALMGASSNRDLMSVDLAIEIPGIHDQALAVYLEERLSHYACIFHDHRLCGIGVISRSNYNSRIDIPIFLRDISDGVILSVRVQEGKLEIIPHPSQNNAGIANYHIAIGLGQSDKLALDSLSGCTSVIEETCRTNLDEFRIALKCMSQVLHALGIGNRSEAQPKRSRKFIRCLSALSSSLTSQDTCYRVDSLPMSSSILTMIKNIGFVMSTIPHKRFSTGAH